MDFLLFPLALPRCGRAAWSREGETSMDKKNDSVLYLLQDIKELLLGMALVLFAIALILLGLALIDSFNSEFLFIVGPIVLAYGGFHIWHGWTAHKLVEKKDDASKN